MTRRALLANATLLTLLAVLSLPGCGSTEACGTGLTSCGGGCHDLATSVVSCGACFNPCPAGGSCVDGSCRCPEGQTACGGTCVDLSSSAAHCGACGNTCGAGSCVAGGCVCRAGAEECPGTQAACTDLLTDPAHCGTCDAPCGVRESCVERACVCAPPNLPCAGVCTAVLSDPEHCGGCGEACPLLNDVCDEGRCTCPPSLPTPCGDACVSTDTDARHCGGCGSACSTGEICTGGLCCGRDQAACPGASGPRCATLATDPESCGACGRTCPAGATCSGGECVCEEDRIACGASCCAGTACCATGCQVEHSNGLGGRYRDCGALGEHTREQALLAAASWGPAGQTSELGMCNGYCLCRTDGPELGSGVQAAVWCYEPAGTATNPLRGRVRVTPEANSCMLARCPPGGDSGWD